jgi:hypothetical protein
MVLAIDADGGKRRRQRAGCHHVARRNGMVLLSKPGATMAAALQAGAQSNRGMSVRWALPSRR